MKKYIIEIAVDNNEASEFMEWLNKNGHEATIGKSTGNYVDGECTSNNEYANRIMNELWEEYCNS